MAHEAEQPQPPAPRPPSPPVRRGESQKDIERGIIRWMFVFFFGTHLIGGAIWLAIYLSGHGGT
ncbi:MAG: hypothetical protein HOV68_01885 [Streptomycetaceae bacterium]|nr:hypothetical protein [Streptomycetaceae bacterium]